MRKLHGASLGVPRLHVGVIRLTVLLTQASLVCAVPISLAGQTAPPAITFYARVLGREFVTAPAVGLMPVSASDVQRLSLARSLSVVNVPQALLAGSGGSAVLRRERSRVLSGEFVPVYAMRLPRIVRKRRLAAQRVFARRHGLQVRGIHTPPISTEMVQLDLCGDRPHEDRIRGTMREPHAPAAVVDVGADFSIPIETEAGPIPALIGSALLCDPGESDRKVHRLHSRHCLPIWIGYRHEHNIISFQKIGG